MAASLMAPRYSADDFETTSIRSAAPSYGEYWPREHILYPRQSSPPLDTDRVILTSSSVSDAPSYHSNPSYQESLPPYAPPENRNTSSTVPANNSGQAQVRDRPATQQQTIGLPPVPSAPPLGVPSLHNFRIPTWSTRNAPAARQLHSVIERRVNAGMESGRSRAGSSSNPTPHRYQSTLGSASGSASSQTEEHITRPLEDPYLVGERAAEQAKRERLARERGDDILIREDKQWDWMLGSLPASLPRLDADVLTEQMKTWEERERSFSRFRREVDNSRRGKWSRRMGGRI